jgi:hypothetical protein
MRAPYFARSNGVQLRGLGASGRQHPRAPERWSRMRFGPRDPPDHVVGKDELRPRQRLLAGGGVLGRRCREPGPKLL